MLRHPPLAGRFALLVSATLGACSSRSDIASANAEIVREWFAALDAQDYDALTRLMDEQFVIRARVVGGPERSVGREAAFELIRSFYRSFPDYTHEIQELVAAGDRVAARVILRGTHQGTYSGIPPTGRTVGYAGTYFITVRRGVLTEAWSLDDEINLLSQLQAQSPGPG